LILLHFQFDLKTNIPKNKAAFQPFVVVLAMQHAKLPSAMCENSKE